MVCLTQQGTSGIASLPNYVEGHPGTYILTSAQAYVLYLWIALARYFHVTPDPDNTALVHRINGGKRPYPVFPPDMSLHSTAPALYLSEEDKDAVARTSWESL